MWKKNAEIFEKLIMRKAKYARYLSPVVYLQQVNIPLSFFLNINLPQVLVPAGHLSYHLLATDFRLQFHGLCFDKYHRLWIYLVVFLHELYNSAARLWSSTTIQGNLSVSIFLVHLILDYYPLPPHQLWRCFSWPGCLTGTSNFLLLKLVTGSIGVYWNLTFTFRTYINNFWFS